MSHQKSLGQIFRAEGIRLDIDMAAVARLKKRFTLNVQYKWQHVMAG